MALASTGLGLESNPNPFEVAPMIRFFLLLVSVAGSSPAAEPDDPIDARLSSCRQERQTTLGTLDCLSAAASDWEAQLNKAYKALRSTLDEPAKKGLLESQRDWLKFRESEEKWIGNTYGGRQGTIYGIYAAEARLELLRARVHQFRSYMDGLGESH